MQTSHQPYSSPPLLNHGSNTLQMNKHLHPFSVRATLESKKRETERKKEMEIWWRSAGKRWQMEGWINVEMNQQESNKAMARFSGSSHNSSDLSSPWHNYHSCSNYFSLLNRFLMAGCAFYDHVCKVKLLKAVVQPCRLRLYPQTCTGRGKGWRGRRWAGVSGEWARPQTSTSLAQQLCQNSRDMCVQYVSTNGRQI